jgi:hypothetical protein
LGHCSHRDSHSLGPAGQFSFSAVSFVRILAIPPFGDIRTTGSPNDTTADLDFVAWLFALTIIIIAAKP